MKTPAASGGGSNRGFLFSRWRTGVDPYTAGKDVGGEIELEHVAVDHPDGKLLQLKLTIWSGLRAHGRE